MSVKRNSLDGLRALIDLASGTPTGGSTDDLGEGQVYVAKIVRQVSPDSSYRTKIPSGIERPSKLYKIKLEEELGNSATGGELLLDGSQEDMKELLPNGNDEQMKAMENFVVNMLPEGIFIGTETAEFPDIGDEVYATSDGGIEGRYLLSLKNGQTKSSAGGYGADSATADAAASNAFKGANGEPVPSAERKEFLLRFTKQDMVKDAVEIKSDFGKRAHPETAGNPSRHHHGIDISTNRKHSVLRAPMDGTVILADFQAEGRGSWKNGNWIKIRHPDGTISKYLHLHTIDQSLRPGVSTKKLTKADGKLVGVPSSQKSSSPVDQRVGEERKDGRQPLKEGGVPVKKGDVLGTVGTSGASTGIHLHWEFGGKKDPYAVVFEEWKFKIA